MSKRSYRRFATDEKRMILTEISPPGITLSEVCRKHSVSPALVYRWRADAQQATTQALQKVDCRGKSQPDAQTARLQAELNRMRHVVTEITAENLELKKTLGMEGRVRLSAQRKQEVLDLVELTQRRSRWPLPSILCSLGLPRSVYFEWHRRAQNSPFADSVRSPQRDSSCCGIRDSMGRAKIGIGNGGGDDSEGGGWEDSASGRGSRSSARRRMCLIPR